MSFKLFACGDVVNFTAKHDFIDENLKSIIKDCDIAICNFEGPIKIDNMRPIKKVGPHIYQSKESIRYIRNSGFNFVTLANNHIHDYGQCAIGATIEELRNHNINFVGAGLSFDDAYKFRVMEKNGIKIGFLAACENEFGCLYEKKNTGGYAWIFHPQIEDNIKTLKKVVDFIVFIAHAGVENIDIPIKEWRERYKRLCDVGVDVLVGHHPHVPQGYENYGNSIIFYSLGNFYFDAASFADKSNDSFSVVFEFQKEKKINFEIICHKMINGQVQKVNDGDVNFDLCHLNSLLYEGYEKLNDELVIKLFNSYYISYYERALAVIPWNAGLLNVVKKIITSMFSKDKDYNHRNIRLLHNIRIETHRFVVQRALSLISE